jgi:hypothetical protein
MLHDYFELSAQVFPISRHSSEDGTVGAGIFVRPRSRVTLS